MGFDGGSGSAEIRAMVHLYGAEERKKRVENESVRVFFILGGGHGGHGGSGVPEMWRLDVEFRG